MTQTLLLATFATSAQTRGPSIFQQIGKCVSVMRQRKALARMDDVQLQDIGITRAQANAEVARKFWDFN